MGQMELRRKQWKPGPRTSSIHQATVSRGGAEQRMMRAADGETNGLGLVGEKNCGRPKIIPTGLVYPTSVNL